MELPVYQGFYFAQSVVVLQVPLLVIVEDVKLERGHEDNCCAHDL
jgi:hypothetical protein